MSTKPQPKKELMIIFEWSNHRYKQVDIDQRISEYYKSGEYHKITSLLNEKISHLHSQMQHEGGSFRVSIVREGIAVSAEGLSTELLTRIEDAIIAHH